MEWLRHRKVRLTLCEPHWIAVGGQERELGPRARRLGSAPEELLAQWAATRTDTPGTLLTWLNLRVKATTFGARLCFSFLLHPQLANSWEAESTEFSQDAKPRGMCLDSEHRVGSAAALAMPKLTGEGRGLVCRRGCRNTLREKAETQSTLPHRCTPFPKISMPKYLLLSPCQLL